MKIISVGTCKGGVGKTAISTNIAAMLAKEGSRVLYVDSDPQCNATEAFGISLITEEGRPSFKESETVCALFTPGLKTIKGIVLKPEDERGYLYEEIPTLHAIPGSMALMYTERNLITGLASGNPAYAESEVLRNNLITIFKEIEDNYDYLFFDTNTYFSQVNENIFAIVDTFLSVCDPSFEGLMGTMTFSGMWTRTAEELGKEVDFNAGIIFNRYRSNTNLSKKIYQVLKGENLSESEKILYGEFSEFFIDCPISESVKFGEASYISRPICLIPEAYKVRGELENLIEALKEKELL